ncbi:MAG: hypothetical protein NWE84_01375 [Candidatus Bathyarchaeota archaeon]|nr:hypothetical protein [Candidatus Bathyarchaeota archaeon]
MSDTNQTLRNSTAKPSGFQLLFDNLAHLIDVSRKKFDLTRASNSDKQKWARLLIQGCQAYGVLLEKRKLEDLENRLQKLETQTFEPQASPMEPKEDILSRLIRESNLKEQAKQLEANSSGGTEIQRAET